MSHIYLSNSPEKELFGEYVYYLLVQRGGFQNIKKDLREYILNKVGKKKISKSEFLSKLSLQDFNYLFERHIASKFFDKSRKFDTFTLPSVLTANQFRNRSPLEIVEEKEEKNYILLKDILEKGFPLAVSGTLYVFFIGEVSIDVYHKFYQGKNNLFYSTLIKIANEEKGQLVFMLENRDYFNTLLFLYALVGILKEPEVRREMPKRVIVWKRSEGEGSFFEITKLDYVISLLSNKRKVDKTSLAKTIALFFALRSILEKRGNEKVIDKLLDEFAYYLLVKQALDPFVIDQLVSLIVKLNSQSWIRTLNKKFVVEFMEEATNYKYDDYFQLGQDLRSKIYTMVNGNLEQFEKIIDRFAKDLRNEELPEYFAETFERDLVWLKTRGLKLSKDLTEKIGKLLLELKTQDLGRFYLIKAAIILGLISPLARESSESKEENANKGEIALE